MYRYRLDESWGAPLFAGVLTAAGAWLIYRGVQDTEAGPLGGSFHPGFATLALPLGILALLCFAAVAWTRRARRPAAALIAALLAALAVGLLMASAAVAYKRAVTCLPLRYCDAPPYPALPPRAVLALILLIPDMVGTALIVLNSIDAFVRRRTSTPGRTGG